MRRNDLLLHCLCGVIIAMIFYRFGIIPSVSIVAFVGGVKELFWDKFLKKGTPEWIDFLSTVIGGLIGIAVIETQNLILRIWS